MTSIKMNFNKIVVEFCLVCNSLQDDGGQVLARARSDLNTNWTGT